MVQKSAIETPDFSSIPDEAVDEIYKNGEACLAGTVQLAIAADQRGTTMAGIFGAGAVALLAVAATIKSAEDPDAAFLFASLATSFFLFIAAWLCAWSARPIDFHIAGYEPSKFAVCAGNPVWMKRYASADIQMRITNNRRVLENASRLLNMGAIFAALAPFTGVATYAYVTCFTSAG